MAKATGKIKIVKLPAGSAPKWVRRAWVGLELPCFPIAGHLGFREEKDALSGKPVNDGRSRSVVVVPQDEALEILRGRNPRAADWWESRGFPHPMSSGERYFCFGEYEVEFISGVKHQKIEHYLGILEIGC